jgi:hypothetical protein
MTGLTYLVSQRVEGWTDRGSRASVKGGARAL